MLVLVAGAHPPSRAHSHDRHRGIAQDQQLEPGREDVRHDTVPFAGGGCAGKPRVGSSLGRLDQLPDRGRVFSVFARCLSVLGSGSCAKTVKFDTRRYCAALASGQPESVFQAGKIAIFEVTSPAMAVKSPVCGHDLERSPCRRRGRSPEWCAPWPAPLAPSLRAKKRKISSSRARAASSTRQEEGWRLPPRAPDRAQKTDRLMCWSQAGDCAPPRD